MSTSLIGLGSNLGDPPTQLRRALALMTRRGLSVERSSSLHRTSPVGGPPAQPDFTNAVAVVRSDLTARGVFEVLASIEDELGRTREHRWEARTIDLDLLLHGDEVIWDRDLVVPHPRMAVRQFVIAPACEVAPKLVHPTVGWTLQQIAAHLESAASEFHLVAPTPDLCDRLVASCQSAYPGRIGPPSERRPSGWPDGTAARLFVDGIAQPADKDDSRDRQPRVSILVESPAKFASARNCAHPWPPLWQASIERSAQWKQGICVPVAAADWNTTAMEVWAVLESAFPGLGPASRSGVQ